MRAALLRDVSQELETHDELGGPEPLGPGRRDVGIERGEVIGTLVEHR